MNFEDYMNKVEEKLSVLTEEEKTAMLRNFLRSAEEKKRGEILLGISNEPQDLSFNEEKEALEIFCAEIESGEIHFYVSGYEEYQEAPWGEEYYEEYEDRDKIGFRYMQFIGLGEKLLSGRRYNEALYFYETLLDMIFYAYSEEYGELTEVSIEQAIEEGLIKVRHRHNLLHLLYTIYQVHSKEKRCQKIFRVLSSNAHQKIKLDELFVIGPEEPENRQGFMVEWIDYLSSNGDDYAAVLLSEASDLFGGTDYLAETARETGAFHPMLYLKACTKLNIEERYDEAFILSLEAMEKLRRNLVIRSEIAKAGYIAAEAMNNEKTKKKYIVESYYSGTSPIMFLDLCGHFDRGDELEEASKYAEHLPLYEELEADAKSGQWQENSISKEEKEAILFFSGKWDLLYEKFQKDTNPLGWSISSKGIIIPLYLLALNSHDELHKAGSILWDTILHRLGRNLLDEKGMNDAFTVWRQKYKMSDYAKEKYYPWIKTEIENRVTGIVENSYRKSYHKAALLIAVLGEVMESNGEIDAKINLITFYRKKYSRRSAFRAELDILL